MGRRLRIDDLYSLAIAENPALAPDGRRIVCAVSRADRDRDEQITSLWHVDIDSGERFQLTQGPHDTAPIWSPDGATIAFLRALDGHPQVWLLATAGGEPRPLTSLPAGCGRPVWSPDGRRIAVAAPARVEGFDPSAPVVINRLGAKVGDAARAGSHVYVADIASGHTRRLTSGEGTAAAPAWSPDGAKIAFVGAAAAVTADLELISAAYVVDVEGAGTPRLVGGDKGTVDAVDWLPDGDALLVVGRSSVHPGNSRLLRVPLDGGPATDLTDAHDRNVLPGAPAYPGGLPAVTADGCGVLVCVRDGGRTALWRIDLATHERRALIDGTDRVVSGLSAAAGRAAVVVSGSDSYGELAVVDDTGGDLRVLTRFTREALPDVELFAPEPRKFRSADGTVIEGWLIRDPEASTPGPLVLDLHGGPHNAWTPALSAAHLYHQVLAAAGVCVLLLNPRGSDGYGERFLTAAIGKWGVADEADVLGPVQQLIDDGLADAQRLGVCGYSYGGYLTCYLTGRTDRFAAAIAGGVVADLRSMVATSDQGQSLGRLECKAPPYGGDGMLRAQSPIERIDQVATPTLILQGAADLACPVGQAEQWFTGLRQRGVATELVLYPSAGHGFIADGRPSHRIDYNARIVDWMTRRLLHVGGPYARSVS